MTFTELVSLICKEKAIEREKLACYMCISPKTLEAYESGIARPKSVESFRLLSRFFNLPLNEVKRICLPVKYGFTYEKLFKLLDKVHINNLRIYLGQTLKFERQMAGVSVESLALMINKSASKIRKAERGEADIKNAHFEAIADALKSAELYEISKKLKERGF